MQPATPARRPPAEREVRDWIYQKALECRYFEDGVRTKEEKSIFIRELGQIEPAQKARLEIR